MNTKKIILAGTTEKLSAILPQLPRYSHLELIALLSDSSDALPSEYKKLYHPVVEYEALRENTKEADWLFHMGSDTIFSPEFLHLFRCGAINVHLGILPNYAGMYPYQWAIRNDEVETGATLHWMTEGLDTGPIALQETFKIDEDDTGLTVYTKCNEVCLSLIHQALKAVDQNENLPILPQDKFKRKYYTHNDSLASEVDWSSSSRKVFNFIRAGNFLPQTSPSYTAKTHFKLSPFQIFNARLGERALGVPGMISSLKEGYHIVCGDGFTVVLSKDTEAPPLKVGDILG